MLYNNFIELRCECSFLDRVLAKNDVNETKKTYFSNEAERVSLARELHKREAQRDTASQAHRKPHVGFGKILWARRLSRLRKATLSALAACVGCESFGSVASRKNSVT